MSIQSKQLEKRFNEGLDEMVPNSRMRKILLNAVEVFAKKGFIGSKIKDIAKKAGFSQGFIYNYFKSKDEIYVKIADLAAQGAGNSVRYAMELKGTPYEKIYWLTEAYLSPKSIAMQHFRLIMIQAATLESVPKEAIRVSKEKIKKAIEYLISIIIEGQEKNEIIKENPLVLAITYFSIIQGLGITRLQNSNDIPFPSIDLILSFLRNN